MKLKAILRIGRSGGDIFPGEIFEADETMARRLLEAGAALQVDGEEPKVYDFGKELRKLKVDELRNLAQIVGVEAEGKKDEIVELLQKAIPSSDLHELEGLSANEIRAYLGDG